MLNSESITNVQNVAIYDQKGNCIFVDFMNFKTQIDSAIMTLKQFLEGIFYLDYVDDLKLQPLSFPCVETNIFQVFHIKINCTEKTLDDVLEKINIYFNKIGTINFKVDCINRQSDKVLEIWKSDKNTFSDV